METTAVTKHEDNTTALQSIVQPVIEQVNAIKYLLDHVLKPDTHYGVIAGTTKPTLYKAGAEKIGFMARLAPSFERKITDHPDGHRDVISQCTLVHRETGEMWGSAAGSCSTKESKYLYRYYTIPEPIPDDYKQRKATYKREGYRASKEENQWVWQKKEENKNPHEEHNTVLKMADKRAYVAAMLFATGASDFFTQDIEDMPEFEGRKMSPLEDADTTAKTTSTEHANGPKLPTSKKDYDNAKARLVKKGQELAEAFGTGDKTLDEIIEWHGIAYALISRWKNTTQRGEAQSILVEFMNEINRAVGVDRNWLEERESGD